MNTAVPALSAETEVAVVRAADHQPLSFRLTLVVWAAASIGGWALVLLALLPIF